MKLVFAVLTIACLAVMSVALTHHASSTADAAVAMQPAAGEHATPVLRAGAPSCEAPDVVAPAPASVLYLDHDAGATAGKCVPTGGSCKGPGKTCCGYCCSGTCRKHANCKD